MAEVSLLPSLWASSVSTTVLTILLHSRLSLTAWIVKNFFLVPCISSKPSWMMESLMSNCPSQISRITWWSSSSIIWSTLAFGDRSKWNPCTWGILNLRVFQLILWANFYCCPHLLMTLLWPASPFLNLKLGQLYTISQNSAEKKWKILTAVGTRDSSFSRFSTATLSIPEFLTYMASCTALTWLCHCTSSTCARDLHCIISWGIPMLCTWSIGIRHRGQGQRPRLHQSYRGNLLLFIISRMCKYTRVKVPTNFVTTFYHHSMPIHLQKVIIEDEGPLSMIQFSSTVC